MSNLTTESLDGNLQNTLQDKVVLVTGAGNGIGRAIAHYCAAQGARVVVNDFGTSLTGDKQDSSPAETVVNEIKEAGGQAVANLDSVSDPEGAQRMVDLGVETWGRIDGVVNNAGVLRDKIFHKMGLEDWKLVIDTHLNGSFYTSIAAAQHFKAQGSGAFVHMTSPTGVVGMLGQANYGAAKSGIIGLSKAIALDMKRAGVRSNTVSPSAFTRMLDNIVAETPEQKARLAKAKLNTPEKVAPLIAYLLSDLAEGITGQIFGVRRNELMLFNQIRPIRSVAYGDGWTQEAIHDSAIPSMKRFFTPLDGGEYFAWDSM